MLKNNINDPLIDYTADVQRVINELEATHPIFPLRELPVNYDKYKTEYLKLTNKPISSLEFRLATQKYLAILGDGHISMGLAFKGNTLYIDISWIANNGKLYLLDDNKKPTNIEIVNIGGKPTSDITAQVDVYYAAENEAARQHNYALFCRQEDMFMMAGCSYTNNDIEIATSDGKIVAYKLIPFDIFRKELNSKPKYIINHKVIDDVFYIDLRAFQKDNFIETTAEEIKTAINNGTKKFIINICNNNGGNSEIGAYLLRAMGMIVPRYGVYMRHSKLLRESTYREYDGESTIIEPTTSNAVTNGNISLLVLIDINTFSSATMLGAWVQDGKLGKIVGQTSCNKPSMYGEMLGILLPISGFALSISCKKFLRPDKKASPDSLIPDIQVPFGDDILTAELKYMYSI